MRIYALMALLSVVYLGMIIWGAKKGFENGYQDGYAECIRDGEGD